MADDGDDCEMCDGSGEVDVTAIEKYGSVPCPDCVSRENASNNKRIAELEAARNRQECLHLSALDKIAQLLTGRDANEIAWWVRANHADFLASRGSDARDKIISMADAAEAKAE